MLLPPNTAQITKPHCKPNACEITPINKGPIISPNSLKEPATPIVAPIAFSAASLLTRASEFVHTTPMPMPATIQVIINNVPVTKRYGCS